MTDLGTTPPGTNMHNVREEVLEHIWRLEEGGRTGNQPVTEGVLVESVAASGPQGAREELQRLEAEGLVRSSQGSLTLTEQGRVLARHVVRANRLAATLLTDLLELPGTLVETYACRLEHAINPLLADRLCTLLGHPPTAPDGNAIPPGACCQSARTELSPAVHALTGLDVGSEGRVTFIRSRAPERLNQLSALGLMPGMQVRLTQRHPTVVLQVAESTIALEHDVAHDIYVKPV